MAPPAPVISAITDDNGASDSDFVTNDPTLIYSGTGEARATLTIQVDGAPQGTTTVSDTSSWSFDNTGTTWADDTYTLTAWQTDVAGNMSPSTQRTFVIDTVDPVAAADDVLSNSASPLFAVP